MLGPVTSNLYSKVYATKFIIIRSEKNTRNEIQFEDDQHE